MQKYISDLLVNGETVTGKDDIIDACRDFYAELYTAEPVDDAVIDSFVSNLPFIPAEDRLQCEGPLTVEECLDAIKGMENGKSPGVDGLPKEFYHKFFPLFGADFVTVMSDCFEEGFLCPSQRHGLITLICKDKNRKNLLNCWRPISPLTVDLKVVSKVMCNRLSKVLGGIIGVEQTCSIPKRSIQDQLHLIRSLFSYVSDRNIPCIILSLDQAKAFDRVSHHYMFKCLERYGFGPDFISWVKLLYNNITSSVMVNGFMSPSFFVQRSVRQGCGLSPLLYVLCIEPLTRMVCLSPNISGCFIPGSGGTLKVVQYADDTTVMLRDEASVTNVLSISNLFQQASGAKLNREKCKEMWLGSLSHKFNIVNGVSFEHTDLKCVGFFFNRFHRNLGEAKWSPNLSKFSKVLKEWETRNLTFRGRALISSVFACSKLWYVGKIILMEDRLVSNFNAVLFPYIWKGQKNRVWRDVLSQPTGDGGQEVVSIAIKLKAFRIKHVLD